MMKLTVATLAVATLLGSTAAMATDIEVIHWWTSPGESRAVAEFAKAVDGDGQDHWVDGAIADGATARAAIMQRVLGGNPPGAAQFNPGREYEELIKNNLLLDLTPLAEKEGWDKIIRPAGIAAACHVDGHWWCVPVNIHSWNWGWASIPAFKQAGLDLPKNWDEFIADAPKLKAAGIIPFAMGAQPWQLDGAFGAIQTAELGIADREKLLKGPAEPTAENLRLPEVSRLAMSALNGAHTTFPMPKMPIAEFAHDKDGKSRDIMMVVDEAILNECAEARQMVWFADVTVENRPMMISSYTVPEASGNFCQRGGRFGSHSSNESMAPVYYKKMVFIAFFNAGVRALDIRDPYHPLEVGYFIPSITKATDKRCVTVDGKERCKVAIQTNNVETDERGYIYIVDRANTGLHILELTGPARAVAGLP